MGQSTDGQICFGIPFEEGYGFPWSEDEFDNDIDKWWQKVNGYEPLFEIYNAKGEYMDGSRPSDEKINEYYSHRRKWREANPIPIVLVNYCSGEYPMDMIALPSSVKSASRGYPEAFDPKELVVTDLEIRSFIDFLEKYEIEYEGQPQWYLSSYWG